MNIIGIAIGSICIAIVATHIRGLTLPHYALYMLGQGTATAILLYFNKEMNPLHFAVGVTAFVNLFAVVIVWFKGVPITPVSVVGVVLITVGTYLTFQ